MQDNAPDLSMDYSFLLESPVLDREESLVSPHGNDLHRFAVSKLSHQGARQVTDDDESFLLPTPLLPLNGQVGVEHEQPREQGGHLVTPQHKQEILSSLFRSRGSATATGARTRIDESDISEGITGDESGWTLPDPATAIKAEDGANGTMEERLDALQLAFSTPIAASQAGSVAIPPLCVPMPGSGGEPRAGLPPSGKKRGGGAKEANDSKVSRDEVEHLRAQIMAQDAEIAQLSMQSSVFATLGARSTASSPQTSVFNSVSKNVPTTAQRSIHPSAWKDRTRDVGVDASDWTMPGARTPGMSMIAKGAPTPSGKDGEIQMLRQMLEEREEEISRLREAEHDLSMSLDRVVYELQTDIQKSKEESSTLQAKLQDQVFKMGDYILRLETSLFQAQQAASSSHSSERPISDTSAALSLSTSLVEKRANRACSHLALSSWVSAVRALRAKRCGIVRVVTKSRRNKALQALVLWAHNRSMRARVERKAATLVRRLQPRRMLVALQTWLSVKIKAQDFMRKTAMLIGRKRVRSSAVLGSSMRYWEAFSSARQMRRRLEERLTSKFVKRRQERVMDRWGTLACWAQRLKGILEGAALKWIWKCEIGALTHWRVVSKHGRDLQRSVLLCRPEAKSLNLLHDDGQTERKTEPGAEVDNMNLVRQFMQQWADDTFVDSVSRRLLQRLVRLAQKRMLSKALSSWKDERGSSLLCFGRANQDLVVEAVRKNILRLATKCFWGWVAFLHSRQKTTQSFFVVNGMQDRSLVGRSFLQWVAYRRHGDRVFEVEKHIRSSRFVVRQAAISLCRALGTWVKYVRCQRRNDTLVHNALFRIRRMTLRSCLYAWKHIFEISKSLLRRQEIFIQRRAALVGVESVCNWKKRVAERLYIRSVISAKFNKAKRLQVKKAFVSWQVYMEYQKQMTVKMLKVRGKLNVSCRKHVFWAWTSMVSKSKRLKRYVKSLQVRRGMVALKSWQSIMEMLDTIGITVGTSPVALDHVSTSPLASDQPRHPSHFDTHCTASCSTPLGDDSSKNSPIPQKSLEAEPEQCKSLGEVPERFSMTPSSPPLQLARRYLGTPRSHRPANRQVLIAKLEEQEGRMLQLQNKLEEEREAGELKLQKMMIELEQALEHATKARSGTASIEPIPGSRRRSSQPKTPMPTSPSMSPLIGASPLQTHVLSMISGSNNSLFGVPPSPLSPPKERKMLRMRAKRAFNAWRVTGLAGRQQRLLVLQVMMCRKRSNARAVMSIFFTLWLIHLRQSLKISTAGTALYIQYQRLLIESCFYEWAEIPRQSEQVNSSSYLKEPIEWQVLPSPQKMAPPKEDVPSSPCDTPAVDQELLREIQQYREEISTLNFQLQEQQESGKRTSNILQEQLLGMQEEVQNLLSELEREKQRFALCICTTEAATSRSVTSTTSVLSASPSEPRSIFPLHTRALALALWSWRSGVDHGRMLEYSAKCACVQKQKYRCQRFFASWYERSVRTSRIMQAGKSMYRRRMALLARKYLLQMVQHVRINLRLRLVHTPVGELLEHATKESRQQQFSSTEHRVNLQFRRSLNIWSFAFWKGFLRVSKKRRHERAAALRIHSHCQMRNVKKKFGEWSSLSIFDRYLTQRLRLRIQRQIVFILRSSFQRWVLCAQNSKRRVFKGTSVLRSTLISLKRRVFSVFVLHAEILNRLRCSVLQMLFRQSCSRLATAFGAWASLTKQHRAHTLHCTRMLLLFSARRERVVKANVVIALQAEAEKAQNARKRKRKGALASSKCCRRQRLARTMKAWAFHIIQQTHREHTIMCRHESVSKRSFCFTAWKGAGSRNQVGVSSLQTRKCRGMLHHAFFCLCAQGHRRRHVRGVLKRFSSRHEQLKVARVFGKWVRLSQERQWVRRCSLKSCALFEKRVFIRCARYWFAAHLHRRSSHERVASLLVATEQALAIRSLREWSVTTERQRRVNSLIGMKRCYPVVLASAGIFWWRQICVRERTRRIFDRIFTSFHRRHSLRSTIAVWCGAVGHSRIRTSACSAVERKVEQYHEGIKEMVVWGWASLCSEKGFSRSLRAFRAGDWRPLSAHGTLCFQLVDAVTASQRGRIDRVLLSRRRSRMATLALKNWQSFIHTQMVLKQGLSRGKMRSRKGRKSLLFKEWANVQHYGHSLRVLLRKVAMQKSRCVMSKAFRCLVPSQPNAALVRLPRFGYNRLNKSNYFVAWSLWASEQRRVCKIQKRQRTQAQRRATLSLCSKMLTRWSHFTRAMCETIEQLRRFVRKWIQRKLSCCLFQWQDDLCRRRTILEKSARKMQHYAQGRAWLTWRDVVKIFRTQRRMLVKGFQKMKRRVEKSAWLTWQNHFKLARRQRYCLQKMSRKWRTCLVYRALMNWESSAKEMRRQWRIMHIILLRLQNMTLYKVWYTWRNNVIELCRQQSVLSKMAARIKNVTLMKAWRTWTPLLEKSSESWCKLQHLVRLTDHGCVRRHFRSWLQVVLCSGAEAIAPQKQQCDHLRMLVVSMQGRRRKRAIFNQWWILLKRSHTLNGIAATIAAKSRGYVLWKCLSMWIHAREHTRQQTARISEESMSVRIRMLTNRRLEHIAARTLRLHLRDYLRAWQDGTGFHLHVASRFQRATRESVLKCFQDWTDFILSRGVVQQNLALLCGALLIARQTCTTAWIEAVKRGRQAEDVVEMRSSTLIKKAALDHWRVKCLVISAMLPGTGVQRRQAQTQRAVRKCFGKWGAYKKYYLSLGRKLSCFICRRVDETVAIYFGSWVVFTTAQRVMSRRTQRALHFMRNTSFASIFSCWKLFHDLHHRKSRLHQTCAARSQCRGAKLVSAAVMHWQGVTQCGKVHDEMSLRMTAKDEVTSRLKHLSCAQLFKSTITTCEMMRGRQHFAIRALFEYVRQKKLHRRTRQLMLLSTAVRRKTRLLHTVWKTWYQHTLSSRLEAIEQHISTFAQLATSIETRRETHEQSMEEMISILHLRFASWETELLETQTLLHASCESFLPDTDEAARQMSTIHDHNNLGNSTSNSAVSPTSDIWGRSPGGRNVVSAREGDRGGESEQDSHGGAQGLLGRSVTPSFSSVVYPLQEADTCIAGQGIMAVNVVKMDGRFGGGDSGDRDGEHDADSELRPFEVRDVEDKWQSFFMPRPLSPAHSTNANPQE